jgi:hypothetical protein
MGLKALPMNLQPQRLGFLQRGDMGHPYYFVHMHRFYILKAGLSMVYFDAWQVKGIFKERGW